MTALAELTAAADRASTHVTELQSALASADRIRNNLAQAQTTMALSLSRARTAIAAADWNDQAANLVARIAGPLGTFLHDHDAGDPDCTPADCIVAKARELNGTRPQ